jgi:hypothetical protein
MKVLVSASNLPAFAHRHAGSRARNLLRAVLAGVLLVQALSASAALSFVRGTQTTVGGVQFSSTPDSVVITEALTGLGPIISTGLSIPANRIQYDVINSTQDGLYVFKVNFPPEVGPYIIGAVAPTGYLKPDGTIVPQGGKPIMTLFNQGYATPTYNNDTQATPWFILFGPDYIEFVAQGLQDGLPPNCGEGKLNPTPYLPTFAIYYSPTLGYGPVPASVHLDVTDYTGQVYGPLPGNACLSIKCTNLVVETCNDCVPVTFSAQAVDICCRDKAVLQYSVPSGTCFRQNTTTPVIVTASDPCGNSAINYFTVTVTKGQSCVPTPCITINAPVIVAHTCAGCTTVPFNVTTTDTCCSGGVTLVYNPPESTCFPVLSPNTVIVTASDQCGNVNTTSFTVIVDPGLSCSPPPGNCISFQSSNIVAYTCGSCTTVPFTATAVDSCCTQVSLAYSIDTNTCFALNTITPVNIVASDNCGNFATNYITVTVLPEPNCVPTNCITLYCTNVVAYTCSNCTTVPLSALAVDTCCAGLIGPTLTFNPPDTYCFPLNSTTPVQVMASDPCGNTSTNSFTVTVLPGPNCGGAMPVQLTIAPAPAAASFVISWPATNGQLLQSSDLIHWLPIPGATNSPYLVPHSNTSATSFYRLQYH